MNNSRNKKEAARLHNLQRDESEAYAQDIIEQPDKYERVWGGYRVKNSDNRNRRRRAVSSSVIIAEMLSRGAI